MWTTPQPLLLPFSRGEGWDEEFENNTSARKNNLDKFSQSDT